MDVGKSIIYFILSRVSTACLLLRLKKCSISDYLARMAYCGEVGGFEAEPGEIALDPDGSNSAVRKESGTARRGWPTHYTTCSISLTAAIASSGISVR